MLGHEGAKAVVERSGCFKGTVLIVALPWPRFDSIDEECGLAREAKPITPKHIAFAVSRSLQLGWQPEVSGSFFRYDFSEDDCRLMDAL